MLDIILLQTVAANMSGELSLRLETDEVQVTTFFKGLQNHHFQVKCVQ